MEQGVRGRKVQARADRLSLRARRFGWGVGGETAAGKPASSGCGGSRCSAFGGGQECTAHDRGETGGKACCTSAQRSGDTPAFGTCNPGFPLILRIPAGKRR